MQLNILVIGSSGQLACSLKELASDNISISCMGRPDIDLENPETIRNIMPEKKPDVVVNAAAYTAVDKAEEETEKAFAINATGVGQLAQTCEEQSIPLIHVSTDYVFNGTKKSPYLETDQVAPLGVYGSSKLEGERLLAKYCSSHIILRTAWVYSPFGNNFVKTMLRLANSHETISVVGDQRGNPTYAPHLAKMILHIIIKIINEDKASKIWGIYHATGSGEASWYDFAIEIFKQSAKYGAKSPKVNNITTKQYPTPAKRPANSMLDCTKLEKTFNYKLPDWRDGTKDCIKRLLA